MDIDSSSIDTIIDMGIELEENEQGESVYGNTEESEINRRTSKEFGESETLSEEEEEVHKEVVYVTNDYGQYGLTAQELQVALSPITALLLILVCSTWIKSITRKGRNNT